MARLIDSSIVIAFERTKRTVDALIGLGAGEPVGIASITASELLTGVHRAAPADRQERRRIYVEAVLSRVPVLAFDLRAARVHARLLAELTAAGRSIGLNDLLIAATALAHGYEVLTDNLVDFERVPGLVARRPDW